MRKIGIVAAALYIATIFGANWAIERFGIIDVGFGLQAPAGVLFVGAALTFRDVVQRLLGVWVTVGCIVVGAGLSAIVSPTFALASGVAFLLSEGLDCAVYTPLERRWFVPAVVTSNVVGAVVDSVVFLHLAFHSLEFLPGQVWGKLLMTVIALPFLLGSRAVLPRHP